MPPKEWRELRYSRRKRGHFFCKMSDGERLRGQARLGGGCFARLERDEMGAAGPQERAATLGQDQEKVCMTASRSDAIMLLAVGSPFDISIAKRRLGKRLRTD